MVIQLHHFSSRYLNYFPFSQNLVQKPNIISGHFFLKGQIIKSSPSESSTFSSCIESDYTQAPTRGNSCYKKQNGYKSITSKRSLSTLCSEVLGRPSISSLKIQLPTTKNKKEVPTVNTINHILVSRCKLFLSNTDYMQSYVFIFNQVECCPFLI